MMFFAVSWPLPWSATSSSMCQRARRSTGDALPESRLRDSAPLTSCLLSAISVSWLNTAKTTLRSCGGMFMNVDRQEVCIIMPTKRLAALFFMPNTASLSCDVMSILSLFAMKSNTILSRPARQSSLMTPLLALILVGVSAPS